MSDFTFTTAATAVTTHERKSGRLESTYDGLAVFFGLTPGSTPADITDAARATVVEGAHNDGTATGATVTADMLTGRDPGEVAHRAYWKAARAVRIGLVNAIKRANNDDDETETETLVNLLTRAGLKADLEDVIAAWKAAHEAN